MRLPGGQVKELLTELASDEEAHLQFHSDFLRLYAQGILPGLIFSLAWRLTTLAAAVVVLIDHRRALRQLEISNKLVWQRWMYLVRETEKQIRNARPDYRFLSQVNENFGLEPI